MSKSNSRTRAVILVLLLSRLFWVITAEAASPQEDAKGACEALAAMHSANFRVDAAEWIGEAGSGEESLPAHCLFRVMLDPRESGLENMSYGVGFELRLPLEWNGRMLFQGGGGLDGVLLPAIGRVNGAASALERGFAVVSTDGGHQGRNNIDSRFGMDQQAKMDFGWMAVQRSTLEAKDIIAQVYGREPEYSYFMGCSTGGREAMMAAQRMPMEFDGVVAGNPSFNLTRISINQVWSLQTVDRIAPRDRNGSPQLDQAFSASQLQAVADAVLESCDALDGLADGMINDFQACDFTPAQLQCEADTAPAEGVCLASEQVTALNDIFTGARTTLGESLYGSSPYDTGIALPAWRGMHLGNPGGAPANASLGRDTLRLFSITPPDPDLDPLEFDFDKALALTAETAAINDAVATLHTSFAGHGGKMIVYHGLSDQAMWAGALIDWYESLVPADVQGPQQWARLFLVPGMTHCGGGQSTDQFDMLTAIQSWVEEGRAPEQVLATGEAFPDVERPLCPYPQVARFQGGDENAIESFACQ